jgi:hypothetical protein
LKRLGGSLQRLGRGVSLQTSSLLETTRMSEDKFIKYLLTFTAIYFTIHVLIGLARGTI